MNDLPDAVLLRRYLDDGDEAAFAEIVRRYLGLVYHAALRQVGGDAHAAEEIAQAVFTLVARKASSLVTHETLAGWLHTTTRYTAHCHRRRENRRTRREEEARIMHEDIATETNPAGWEHLRPLIDTVLAELNAADRDAILLRFFTGLPFAEIGARLKVSENGARMRVDRALEKLHALLARRGVASTATALGVVLTTQAMASAPAGLAASVTGVALSGATTSSALVTAGIFVMKTKTIILSSVALLAVGVAIFQFKQAQDAEILLAVANKDRDALRERLQPATVQIRGVSAEAAGLQPAAKPGQNLQPASVASPSRTSLPPQIVKISANYQARVESLDSQYGPLYRRLGLNAGQSEKFKAILVENARRNEELTKAVVMQGDKIDPAKQRAIDDQTNAELIAAVRAEFGDSAVQAMDQHERTLPFRGLLDELAKSLFYTETPLTAAQTDQLLDAVVKYEQTTNGKVNFDWMVQPDLYGAMLTQSSGILSAPQIEALRKATEQSLVPRSVSSKKVIKATTNTSVQVPAVVGSSRPGS
ncbi:MAG: sigma-70 family RNA polymerase sigma factor [Nibricoccus sp.]